MNENNLLSKLDPLLHPRSIAIVGASNDFSRVTGRPIKYLLEYNYKGKIFPVNPKYETIGGLKCYANLLDVPEDIECVYIAVSSKYVFEILKQCAEKKVKAIVIYSSGFAETGEEGKERQISIKQFAEKNRMIICGPNSLGIINFLEKVPLCATSILDLKMPLLGRVGFISQSGALGSSISNRILDKGVGFTYIIFGGNEADLEATDYLEFLIEDPNTDVIAAFIEGFKRGREFLRVADLALSRRKPIILLKIGRSEQGAKAAISHTGSLVGSDTVYDAVFRQKAIIRVEDLDELVETVSIFSRCKPPSGNRIGILSFTGGGGGLFADKCVEMGLPLPEPSSKTRRELLKILPSFGSTSNPADITTLSLDKREIFLKTLNLFIEEENYDVIVIILSMTAGSSPEVASNIIELSKRTEKPIIPLCIGGTLAKPSIDVFREGGVPFSQSFVHCSKAIKSLIQFGDSIQKLKQRDPYDIQAKTSQDQIFLQRAKELLKSKELILTEYDSKQVLSAFHIPITREGLASSAREAIEIAETIGYPVALKIVSPDIVHKTEIKAVKLNIQTQSDMIRSYDEILDHVKCLTPNAKIEGILIQEMTKPGIETIIGVSQDQIFGPVIMFGMGGIYAELIKDISLRIAPLTEDEAQGMIREIKGYRILQGFRGIQRADMEAIVDALMKVSDIAVNLKEEIKEIDINPFMVFEKGKGAMVIDATIVRRG